MINVGPDIDVGACSHLLQFRRRFLPPPWHLCLGRRRYFALISSQITFHQLPQSQRIHRMNHGNGLPFFGGLSEIHPTRSHSRHINRGSSRFSTVVVIISSFHRPQNIGYIMYSKIAPLDQHYTNKHALVQIDPVHIARLE